MNESNPLLEQVHALLADRAVKGADSAEQAGIDCLLRHAKEVNADSFDLTAAALGLAYADEPDEPMPADLMSRLLPLGQTIAAENVNRQQIEPVRAPAPVVARATRRLVSPAWGWAGWLVAAAILLITQLPKPDTSPESAYQKLKSQGALVVAGKQGPHGDAQVDGEVVWDDKTQTGYMKLRGLTANDPKQSQFQLWIFDDKPFAKVTPTDGGVFDVTNAQEVIVPIRANLKVGKPSLFAITVERPGGVMVSKREKLVFVASVNQ